MVHPPPPPLGPPAYSGPPPPIAPTDLTRPTLESPPPLPVSAEGGRLSLSLEAAVFLALRSNRSLDVAFYGPFIAGTFSRLERSLFDPELFSDVTRQEETASETSRSTGERFSVEGEDSQSVLGLRKRLPAGADIEAFVSHQRSTSDRAPEQQEARLSLSVTQSLLQGFGPEVNLVDIRLADLELDISRFELRGFVESLVADTEIAYWEYVLAGEEIATFERSLTIAELQLEEVSQRIEVGDQPANAAAAARAEVARRGQALIEARSAREDRRLRLLQLINASSEEEYGLTVSATTSPRSEPTPITDLAERIALADQSRPDLSEARLRLDQDRLEVVRTRNGLLPRLDLFIELGKTGFSESFSDAFRKLNDDTYEVVAGVEFRYPIGNRGAEARDEAARATYEQGQAAVSNLAHLVELDVRLAVNEVERTRQQIAAGAVTRSLQEQTLQAEQERFEVGASTSLLVAQAQRDLLAAQITEIESVVAYRVALVNLYRAEGSLLRRRAIQLP
jgi:outer membrane protein TolC